MESVVTRRDAEWHAKQITESWQKAVPSIIETGEKLIAAKRDLGDESFVEMCKKRLPFQFRTGYCLVAIARDERLLQHAAKLPPSWNTLYEITRFTEDEFPKALEVDVIRPDVERREVVSYRHKLRHRDSQKDYEPSSDWTVTGCSDVIECQVVITDPPYGILDEEWEPADLMNFTSEWLQRWNDAGADFIVSFFSQRYLWEARPTFDCYLKDYDFQHLLVWHYRNNKSPQSRMGFKQTWEPVFVYRRHGCEREVKLGEDWGGDLHDFDCHVAAVPQSNFKDAECKEHPAQKPVGVMQWLVNALTSPGDLVCDPFCGSGTTGIACAQLGRRFHGIETDDDYIELARKRITTYGQAV